MNSEWPWKSRYQNIALPPNPSRHRPKRTILNNVVRPRALSTFKTTMQGSVGAGQLSSPNITPLHLDFFSYPRRHDAFVCARRGFPLDPSLPRVSCGLSGPSHTCDFLRLPIVVIPLSPQLLYILTNGKHGLMARPSRDFEQTRPVYCITRVPCTRTLCYAGNAEISAIGNPKVSVLASIQSPSTFDLLNLRSTSVVRLRPALSID